MDFLWSLVYAGPKFKLTSIGGKRRLRFSHPREFLVLVARLHNFFLRVRATLNTFSNFSSLFFWMCFWKKNKKTTPNVKCDTQKKTKEKKKINTTHALVVYLTKKTKQSTLMKHFFYTWKKNKFTTGKKKNFQIFFIYFLFYFFWVYLQKNWIWKFPKKKKFFFKIFF